MKFSFDTKIENKLDLTEYIDFLNERRELNKYEIGEDSINLPFDSTIFSSVDNICSDIDTDKLSKIFVVGIGGSNLGAMAIHEAFRSYDESIKEIIWLESVDTENLKKAGKTIKALNSKEEVLIVIISKSGGTTETLVNSGILLDLCEKKWGDMSQRVVVVTNQNSKLDEWADEYHAHSIYMPESVGGRFSVFTAVGLLPLHISGVPVRDLLLGAQEASKVIENSFAIESAKAIFNAYKKGFSIHNMFIFAPELEYFGRWYRQLIGESLGKERDIHNNTVRAGILPVVSIGSTDLHSVGQLYIGGPKNIFTTFISKTPKAEITIPKHSILKTIDYVENKEASSIDDAILKAVRDVYSENEMPFVAVSLDSKNIAYDFGFLLQSLMIQIMILGHLMELNTFNQPNVESYKVKLKKNLQ